MEKNQDPVIYVAKYNNVWQSIEDKKPLGNTIEIKDGDNINNYEQVRKPAVKPLKLNIPDYLQNGGNNYGKY